MTGGLPVQTWVLTVKGAACPTRIPPLRALEQGTSFQSLQWSCSVAAEKPVSVLCSFHVWMCNCVNVIRIILKKRVRSQWKRPLNNNNKTNKQVLLQYMCDNTHIPQYMYHNTYTTIHILHYTYHNTCTTIYVSQYMYYNTHTAIHVLQYMYHNTYATVHILHYTYHNTCAKINILH